MKLLNKKTQKAIEKSVRKALRQHGPKLVAAIAGSLASTLATLAATESADKPGKSNLSDVVNRAKKAVKASGGDDTKGRGRQNSRESRGRADDMEDAQPTQHEAEPQPH
jgi:hypothetical protein